MKRIIILGIVLLSIAVVYALSPFIGPMIDQKTFSCPSNYQYCVIEVWMGEKLIGKRIIPANNGFDVKLYGKLHESTSTTLPVTSTTIPVTTTTIRDGHVCGNEICEQGEATYCPPCFGTRCLAIPCKIGKCPKDCQTTTTTMPNNPE